MDSRKLGMLMAAIRTGSLRKAAKECGCTQSAMTQAMDALEAELGFAVIVRSHRGVTLTEAGELLLPSLTAAADALERLAEESQALAADLSAPVRIGVIGGIAGTWLSSAIDAYRHQDPEAKFELLVGADSLAEWLDARKADVLLAPAELCGNHRWHPLIDEPCFVVLPRGIRVGKKALSQEDFASLPFVMAPKGAAGGLEAASLMHCDDDAALLSLVDIAEGAAVIPQSALRMLPKNLQVLELDPPAARTLGVALPNSPRPEAQAFADFLMRNMPYAEPKEETPEERAMRLSIRRALTGSTSRPWVSPIFR